MGLEVAWIATSPNDLVSTVNQLHFIPVDLGAPIVQCAVADPYVVIMSAEGHVTMFLLKSDSYGGRHHRLALHKPPLHHVGPLPLMPLSSPACPSLPLSEPYPVSYSNPR